MLRGLEAMRQRRNIGLKALADAAALAVPPTAYHLGFVLGPRINAGGRIGDAALGARLLAIEDEVEAARIAVLLDRLNRERKAIETAMLDEAMVLADSCLEADPDVPVLVVASESFHKGVVGLVASRLTERFGRPSCVIAWEPAPAGVGREKAGERGQGTGSLRSIAGVDIGAAVRAAALAGHLAKGGGHAMAAGLTVARESLDGLKGFLSERLAEAARTARLARALDIDGALTPSSVTDELIQLIERAGPFGQGNPEPRFAFPAQRVKFAKVVGEAHVRCVLEGGDGARLDAVAFRAADQPVGKALLASAGMPLHVAGHLRRDTWNGRDRRELLIEDVADPRRGRDGVRPGSDPGLTPAGSGGTRQVAQHERQDAAVAVVAELLLGIDAAEHLDGSGASAAQDLHRHLLPGLEAGQPADGYRFLTRQPQTLPGLPLLEHQWEDAHPDQVGAMDALEGLGDDGADAQQARALGRPVAAGAGAVLLAGEHHQRHALRLVAHGGIVDRHGLAGGIVDGVAALLAAHHDVLDADVGEGAAHHDVVVAAARAVRVELGRAHLMLDQVDAGGAVPLDGAGGRDVVGGDAVLEQAQHARAEHVGDGLGSGEMSSK